MLLWISSVQVPGKLLLGCLDTEHKKDLEFCTQIATSTFRSLVTLPCMEKILLTPQSSRTLPQTCFALGRSCRCHSCQVCVRAFSPSENCCHFPRRRKGSKGCWSSAVPWHVWAPSFYSSALHTASAIWMCWEGSHGPQTASQLLPGMGWSSWCSVCPSVSHASHLHPCHLLGCPIQCHPSSRLCFLGLVLVW